MQEDEFDAHATRPFEAATQNTQPDEDETQIPLGDLDDDEDMCVYPADESAALATMQAMQTSEVPEVGSFSQASDSQDSPPSQDLMAEDEGEKASAAPPSAVNPAPMSVEENEPTPLEEPVETHNQATAQAKPVPMETSSGEPDALLTADAATSTTIAASVIDTGFKLKSRKRPAESIETPVLPEQPQQQQPPQPQPRPRKKAARATPRRKAQPSLPVMIPAAEPSAGCSNTDKLKLSVALLCIKRAQQEGMTAVKWWEQQREILLQRRTDAECDIVSASLNREDLRRKVSWLRKEVRDLKQLDPATSSRSLLAEAAAVSFLLKNLHFLLKNLHFLIKNLHI